ncbi:MAG: Hep/Hag repeat protein, partial [Negativicoccus succinicivorans DORA_17_25]
MNKIYKLVWNRVTNSWVAASEVAKSHGKSSRARGRVTLVAAVLGVLMATALPAFGVYAAGLTDEQKVIYDAVLAQLENNGIHYVSVKGTSTDSGSNYKNDGAKGKGAVAIGEKALASKGGTVSIGRNAHIEGNGGNADGEGSVAIGDNSLITTNGLDLASIAIGKNAKVLNGSGKQERGLSFTPDNFDKPGFFGRGNTLPKNADKVPGGIAIGTNSYARTGSIQLGHHTFAGYKMGGIDVTNANEEANIVGMTTVGTNTYNKGALANMYGAYSIITGDFTGAGGFNSVTYGPQNFGANVVGSLNSIRSKGHSGSSGVANSIVGVANTVENANGTLVYGAGNKITNSVTSISAPSGLTTLNTWEDTVTALQKSIKDSKSGGAVLAIGGGNVADYVRHSQLVGVNNTVTGTENKVSEFNMVNGYQNTATNITHVTM